MWHVQHSQDSSRILAVLTADTVDNSSHTDLALPNNILFSAIFNMGAHAS